MLMIAENRVSNNKCFFSVALTRIYACFLYRWDAEIRFLRHVTLDLCFLLVALEYWIENHCSVLRTKREWIKLLAENLQMFSSHFFCLNVEKEMWNSALCWIGCLSTARSSRFAFYIPKEKLLFRIFKTIVFSDSKQEL